MRQTVVVNPHPNQTELGRTHARRVNPPTVKPALSIVLHRRRRLLYPLPVDQLVLALRRKDPQDLTVPTRMAGPRPPRLTVRYECPPRQVHRRVRHQLLQLRDVLPRHPVALVQPLLSQVHQVRQLSPILGLDTPRSLALFLKPLRHLKRQQVRTVKGADVHRVPA